ncbi:MAG TPA: STAS domain-containing protein [Anaerolineales bacterium]
MDIIISIEQAREPVAIMRITGNIDASNFAEVITKAQEAYDNPARNLIIDLSEVPYISSAGLVAIHKVALLYSGVPQKGEENIHPDLTHSSSARKHVKLLSPQPGVDQILETTGMKLFFKVFDDLESAIQSF